MTFFGRKKKKGGGVGVGVIMTETEENRLEEKKREPYQNNTFIIEKLNFG